MQVSEPYHAGPFTLPLLIVRAAPIGSPASLPCMQYTEEKGYLCAKGCHAPQLKAPLPTRTHTRTLTFHICAHSHIALHIKWTLLWTIYTYIYISWNVAIYINLIAHWTLYVHSWPISVFVFRLSIIYLSIFSRVCHCCNVCSTCLTLNCPQGINKVFLNLELIQRFWPWSIGLGGCNLFH